MRVNLLLLSFVITLPLPAVEYWRKVDVVTDETASSVNMISAAYGNGLYAALGYTFTSSLWSSTDGNQWEQVPNNSPIGIGFNFPDLIRFIDGRFLLHMNRSLYSSNDLQSWTFEASTGVPTARHMKKINGVYFIGGEGSCGFSSDLLTWTSPFEAAADYFDLAFGNGVYVLVGRAQGVGILYTSTDGIEWTEQIGVADAHELLYSVEFADGLFGVVGNNGTYGYSADGTSWTWQNGFSGTFQTIRHNGTYWIANTTSRIYISNDITASSDLWPQANGFGSQLKNLLKLNDDWYIPARAGQMLTTAPGDPETGIGYFFGEAGGFKGFTHIATGIGNYSRYAWPWVFTEDLRTILIYPGMTNSSRDGFWAWIPAQIHLPGQVTGEPLGWVYIKSDDFSIELWSASRESWFQVIVRGVSGGNRWTTLYQPDPSGGVGTWWILGG